MLNIFYNCILIGMGIPLLSILLSCIGSVFNIDFDFDNDTFFDGIVPININCLCLASIVFGSVGLMLPERITDERLMYTICVIFAMLSYIVLYRFLVLPLKKSNPLTINHNDLIGKTALVILSIRKNTCGTISVNLGSGGKISYIAKLDSTSEEDIIKQGLLVEIVSITDNVCIVKNA